MWREGYKKIKASTDTGRLLSISERQKHFVLLTRLCKPAGQWNTVLESVATSWLPDEFYYASQGMRDLKSFESSSRMSHCKHSEGIHRISLICPFWVTAHFFGPY